MKCNSNGIDIELLDYMVALMYAITSRVKDYLNHKYI